MNKIFLPVTIAILLIIITVCTKEKNKLPDIHGQNCILCILLLRKKDLQSD
jgi:hypothetical protein